MRLDLFTSLECEEADYKLVTWN